MPARTRLGLIRAGLRVNPNRGAALGAGDRARGAELWQGGALVAASAVVWSTGGMLARGLEVGDGWTVVFWRSLWAAAFLAAFLVWRDGVRGAWGLMRGMGWPGLGVAVCFAWASISFVLALAHTTVANILLIQAGVPLFAALIAWAVLGERVTLATWAAIGAVFAGVGLMVSEGLGQGGAPIGDALALGIALAFAAATVITRAHAGVRMTPAVCLGTLLALGVAAVMAGGFTVGARDMGLLVAFGALNLGLGMALFVTGARLVPAALAALIGTLEPVLGPIWVWLVHSEVPSDRTLLGGAVILAALLAHIAWSGRRGA